MEDWEYQVTKLSELLKMSIFYMKDKKAVILKSYPEEQSAGNPIQESAALRERLFELSGTQQEPLLCRDMSPVFFGCVRTEKGCLLFGPVCTRNMTTVELHRFYKRYGGRGKTELNPPVFTLTEVLEMTGLLAAIVNGSAYGCDELAKANHLTVTAYENEKKEKFLFAINAEKEETCYYTYCEEQKLLECVQEGRVEEAVQYSMDMDTIFQRLAQLDVKSWRKAVVAAAVLCTRAAIEGGVSPVEAYQLCDYYIQKCDEYRHLSELIACRNTLVHDFSLLTAKHRENKAASNHIERCKDYIGQHYKEKIYLDEVAGQLGLSSTYLSKLFVQETGVRFQDYITMFRVDRAANLLLYSEESIANIGEYVNFPSQSYFGSVFKKYKHMTPKKFRDMYKTAEFISRNQ